MERAEIHARFLEGLLNLRGSLVDKVRLVARVYNDERVGGSSVARSYVFLPDFHLVSNGVEDSYKYGFRKVRPGSWVDRGALLKGLCGAVTELRGHLPDNRRLTAVQLGDFVDLWREERVAGQDIQSMTAGILVDHPAVIDHVVRRRRDSLGARLIAGNHERWGADGVHRSAALRRSKTAIPLKVGSKKSILATHGDLFDKIETALPDAIQSWVVRRFSQGIGSQVYDLERRTGDPDDRSITGPEGGAARIIERVDQSESVPDLVNVFVTDHNSSSTQIRKSHPLLPRALEYASALRAGRRTELGRMQLGQRGRLPDLRMITVGHTHHARISLHVDGSDPRKNLVLLDVGAWIENCRFADTPSRGSEPSCQVAFVCGGDARIYQLRPHRSQLAGSLSAIRRRDGVT